MIRRSWVFAFLAAFALAACRPSPAALVAPKAELAGVSIFIKPPQNCEGCMDITGALYHHLELDAGRQGFNVVDKENVPHDVTLETSVGSEITYKLRDAEGQLVEVGSVTYTMGGTVDNVGATWAADIVNRLSQSPRFAAFVTARRGGKPAPAVAVASESPLAAKPAVSANASPAFDVVAATPQPASYALIVGIESYRSLPAPTGARTDAARIETLMKKTFGLTTERVRVLTDSNATRADVMSGIDWLKANASAGSRVYFYFSGHGSPEPSTGTAYLLPFETSTDNLLRSGIKLDELLAALSQTKAREVIAMVDSCFSGTGDRSLLPPGTRALTRVREPSVAGQVVLLSASKADETSGPTNGESVGVFTKFVADGLGKGAADLNGDGQITLQELFDWVGPRVSRDAQAQNRKQTPQLSTGTGTGKAPDIVLGYGYR